MRDAEGGGGGQDYIYYTHLNSWNTIKQRRAFLLHPLEAPEPSLAVSIFLISKDPSICVILTLGAIDPASFAWYK